MYVCMYGKEVWEVIVSQQCAGWPWDPICKYFKYVSMVTTYTSDITPYVSVHASTVSMVIKRVSDTTFVRDQFENLV